MKNLLKKGFVMKERSERDETFLVQIKRIARLEGPFLLVLSLLLWGNTSPVAAHRYEGKGKPAIAAPLPVAAHKGIAEIATPIKEFPLPEEHSDPSGLVLGTDGAVWFTEFDANRIGRMTTKGTFTEFALGDFRKPAGITQSADGNFWFAEEGGWIGRMTPAGVLTEYALPWAGAEPQAITMGADGNLWFTMAEPSGLGKINPKDGRMTLFKLGDDESAPVGMTRGADGNAWFIEQYGKIGFISPGGKIKEFARPNMDSLAFGGITSGPDGAIWYTQGGGNGGNSLIGRMSLKGDILNTFPLADTSANPVGIIAAPDGSLWFAELQSNKIGRITQQGSITEYSLPEKTGGPDYIINGANGELWFSSSVNNYMASIPSNVSVPSNGSSMDFAPTGPKEGVYTHNPKRSSASAIGNFIR